MNADLWYLLLTAIVVAALIWAISWHASAAWHDKQAARRQLEADQRTAAARGFTVYRDETQQLAGQRAPFPTYAGWLYDSSWRPGLWADWQGARDRHYITGASTAPMSAVDALDIAEAAYQLGQQRADADQTHAEAEAIWAEVEADPEQWRHR